MSQYRKLHDLQCLATVPIFAAVVFLSHPILTYVFDKPTATGLVVPVLFLSIGSYMHGTIYVPHLFSLAVGRPEIAARATLLALFVVLPVSAALVIAFGLNGAALSWIWYHVFMYLYAIPRICRECLLISVREWYRHLGTIALRAGAPYALGWYLANTFALGSTGAAIVAYLVASLAFAAQLRWLVTPEFASVIERFGVAGHLVLLDVNQGPMRKS